MISAAATAARARSVTPGSRLNYAGVSIAATTGSTYYLSNKICSACAACACAASSSTASSVHNTRSSNFTVLADTASPCLASLRIRARAACATATATYGIMASYTTSIRYVIVECISLSASSLRSATATTAIITNRLEAAATAAVGNYL